MLEAKTKEQREHVENIVKKYVTILQCCQFLSADVYSNYEESVEINLKCADCDCVLSVDVRFDMMAEIVDYLRKQKGYDEAREARKEESK